MSLFLFVGTALLWATGAFMTTMQSGIVPISFRSAACAHGRGDARGGSREPYLCGRQSEYAVAGGARSNLFRLTFCSIKP